MADETIEDKPKIPAMVYYFAQQTGRDLIQRDIKQRPFMPAGPMFFIFSYWLFQTGGLMGYGLKENISIISKLVFEHASPEDVQQYLSDESAGLLAKPKSPPDSLLELYLVPLLASVGIDFHDKEFIDGAKAGWAAEKQYDMDILDKNAYLAFRQGVTLGYCQPEVFRQCWEKTYAAEPKEQWAEAFKKGLVDAPEQEIVLFPDEVLRVLGEVAEWARKNQESGLSRTEIQEIGKASKKFKKS